MMQGSSSAYPRSSQAGLKYDNRELGKKTDLALVKLPPLWYFVVKL
jgi:hypothetical protein